MDPPFLFIYRSQGDHSSIRRYHVIHSKYAYTHIYIQTQSHHHPPMYHVTQTSYRNMNLHAHLIAKSRSLRPRNAAEGPECSPEQLSVPFKIRILLYVTWTHFNVLGTLLGFRHLINIV